jgi:hypothetical protein
MTKLAFLKQNIAFEQIEELTEETSSMVKGGYRPSCPPRTCTTGSSSSIRSNVSASVSSNGGNNNVNTIVSSTNIISNRPNNNGCGVSYVSYYNPYRPC